MTELRAVCCASMLLVACAGGDSETALSEPLIDTLPGGVIQVTNTGPTAWADTNGWRLVEELVIDPPDGSPGEFSDVTKLVADDAGNVYVMQIMPAVIKAFDARGNWLRDIGRAGDGPGEFRDGMLYIHGDTLLIQDPNNARMTTFLTDGTLIGTAPSQCCSFSSPLPMLDDGLAMITGPAPQGVEEARFAYYLTRLDGTVVDTILRLPPPPSASANATWAATRKLPNGSIQSIEIGIPGQPNNVRVWRNDGLAIVGNTSQYKLAIQREYADTVRIIEAEAPQIVLTDLERDSMFEAAISSQGPPAREAMRAVASASQIPGNRPLWSALATDRDHRIWVGLPGPGTDVATLDVFSPDGVLLGKVPAPHPAILDGFWTRNRVYLRDTDVEGRPLVRVFHLATETVRSATP